MESDNELRSSNKFKNFFLPFALVIAAAAAVVVAIWAYLVFQEVAWVDPGNSTNNDIDRLDLNMLDIYFLKAGMENTYIAVDEYTAKIVDESIAILREAQPELFDTMSETEVRNLVKVNIINNLGKIN